MKTLRAAVPAPFHIDVPAGLLGDSVQFVPHSRARNWVRGLIWLAAVAAVVGLTIATYVTDESIRNSVSVNRKYLLTEITTDDAQHGICPCEKIWLPWGDFMELNVTIGAKNSVDADVNAFLKDQCTAAVSGFTFNGRKIAAGYVLDAASALCQQTMLTVVPAILGRTSTANFVTPNLLGPAAVQRGYEVYVGQTVVDQIRGGLLAYTSLKTVAATVEGRAACQAQNKTDGACAPLITDNQVLAVSNTSAAEAAGIQANQGALGEVSQKILAAFGSSTDPGSIRGLLVNIQGIVGLLGTANWEKYKNSCRPRYCDVFGKKSAVTRITEFLTTVGGVWQSIMIISITLWMVGSRMFGLENFSYLAEPDPLTGSISSKSFGVNSPPSTPVV